MCLGTLDARSIRTSTQLLADLLGTVLTTKVLTLLALGTTLSTISITPNPSTTVGKNQGNGVDLELFRSGASSNPLGASFSGSAFTALRKKQTFCLGAVRFFEELVLGEDIEDSGDLFFIENGHDLS
jgi:hypothetical protein